MLYFRLIAPARRCAAIEDARYELFAALGLVVSADARGLLFAVCGGGGQGREVGLCEKMFFLGEGSVWWYE